MRTTITLDDDVVALIEQARREKRASFKEIVNNGLRQGLGLTELVTPVPFRTRAVDLGEILVENIDDISALLEFAEGPAHR